MSLNLSSMSSLLSVDFPLSTTTTYIAGLAGCLVVGGVTVYWCRNRVSAYVATGPYAEDNVTFGRVLQRFIVDYTRRDISVNFHPMDFAPSRPKRRFNDNGHPKSGSARDSAREVLTNALVNHGFKIVELSPTKMQAGLVNQAIHLHYAPSDLHRSISLPTDIESGSAILGIDTDYYVTDPSVLLGYGTLAAFYTFQPIQVAGLDGEVRFRIVNDEIIYEVDGGARWQHRVWDWTTPGEFVATRRINRRFYRRVIDNILSYFGFECTNIHKIVFARPWAEFPNRAFVWAIPQYSYWRCSWLHDEMNVRVLKRVVYGDKPGWNRLVYNSSGSNGVSQMRVNFGRAGDDLCVDLPKESFDLVMGCASAQSVTSRMIQLKLIDPSTLALTGQYYSGKLTNLPDATYIPRPAAPAVHWNPVSYADMPEVSVRKYGRSIVTQPALAPMIKRWETLSHSLETRVTYVANKCEPHSMYHRFAREFVECLVPKEIMHTGEPMCLEEVMAEMDKPAQQRAIERVWDTLDVRGRSCIEAFVKNEATMKTPRVISSFPDIKWHLTVGQFVLEFNKILKSEANSHWYYPGKTPFEIALGIQDFVTTFVPCETDFSNMDGMTPRALHTLVSHAARKRYFKPKFHARLDALHEKIISSPASAKNFGFRYEAGVGVKSGSLTTTSDNTKHNAFFAYCGIRLTYPTLTPMECFARIGPKAGDDGVEEEAIAKQMTKVVEDFGMVIKIEKFKPEIGLGFLGRVFIDPLNTLTSIQDPLRTLRKLHLTFRDPNIPLADACLDRLKGYSITDALTPIIGPYSRVMTRYYEPYASSVDIRSSRGDARKEVNYWVSRDGSETWPQDRGDLPTMYHCVSNRIGLDIAAIVRLEREFTGNDFDPWHFTPLMVDEESPYDESLDDDCQPWVKWVDKRNVQIQNVTNQRAAGRLCRVTKTTSATTPGRSGQGGSMQSRSAQGPNRVQRIPGRNSEQGVSGNRQPTPQTNSGSGTDGQSNANRDRSSRRRDSRATRNRQQNRDTAGANNPPNNNQQQQQPRARHNNQATTSPPSGSSPTA